MNDTPFKQGFALSFDGVDDYVEVPDHPSLNVTEGLTLEAWIKDSVNASVAFLIKGGQDITKGSYLLYITGDFQFETDLHVGGEWQWTPTGTKLKADEWQHVAMTWDGSTMRAYINGEEIFLTSIKGKLDTTKDPFYIGYTPPNVGGGGQFKGLIDDVRISDVALSADELGFNGPLKPSAVSSLDKLAVTWGTIKQ
ncbi:MAG: LamG domain-containing protein [Deltaproteobacteria bacterium]|nr:LamG domain-containing protein [Deltaproteobacteria bacterium]